MLGHYCTEGPEEAMTSFDFSHLQSADEVIQAAAELRERSDEGRWALGALVCWFVPHRKSGRPVTDEIRTVSWMARAIGVPRSVLSGYAAAWEFWGEVHEEIPLGVSWHAASAARCRVGWRPGERVTEELHRKAFGLLELWMEAPPKPSNPITVGQYIDRAIANIEKALPLLKPAQRENAELALAALEDMST